MSSGSSASVRVLTPEELEDLEDEAAQGRLREENRQLKVILDHLSLFQSIQDPQGLSQPLMESSYITTLIEAISTSVLLRNIINRRAYLYFDPPIIVRRPNLTAPAIIANRIQMLGNSTKHPGFMTFGIISTTDTILFKFILPISYLATNSIELLNSYYYTIYNPGKSEWKEVWLGFRANKWLKENVPSLSFIMPRAIYAPVERYIDIEDRNQTKDLFTFLNAINRAEVKDYIHLAARFKQYMYISKPFGLEIHSTQYKIVGLGHKDDTFLLYLYKDGQLDPTNYIQIKMEGNPVVSFQYRAPQKKEWHLMYTQNSNGRRVSGVPSVAYKQVGYFNKLVNTPYTSINNNMLGGRHRKSYRKKRSNRITRRNRRQKK